MEYKDIKELKDKLSVPIKLTDTVNEKVEEAYAQIRSSRQESTKRYGRPKKFVVILAACIGVLATSAIVLAATGFFSRETHVEEGLLTYEFNIDYELKPGTFEVTPNYIPEGFVEEEAQKYRPKDHSGNGFTLMPILNTADLDLVGRRIQKNDVEHVEHTTLSGMEADVITFKEAEKYQCPTEIFLFNPQEGYVMEVWGDYTVPEEELIKVADQLTIVRTGDDDYATDDEKAQIAQEQAQLQEAQEEMDAVNQQGVAEERVIPVGQAWTYDNGFHGKTTFTVKKAEIMDTLSGADTNNFYDYSQVQPWLLEDGSLRPYIRQHYERGVETPEEETAEQCFLKVKIEVKQEFTDEAEDWEKDVALDACIRRLGELNGSAYGWLDDFYLPVPSENNNLQIDNRCIYLDQPENLEGEERAHSFFYHKLEDGDSMEYELIFVIDKDQTESNLVLDFNQLCNPGTAEGTFFALF